MNGRRIAFYLPANLNIIDGSAIWVATVCGTLLEDPDARVTLPLRVAEQRDLITGGLRALGRVDLLPPPADLPAGRGQTNAAVLDQLERLDEAEPFDVILLRSYELCREAVDRPRFRDRLLSTYILEPERDPEDPAHLAELSRITRGSRFVVCQSDEMRALLESLVPEAVGKTILLPPAIPADTTAARPDPDRPVHRLLYAGKFHPFYPVGLMIDFLTELRGTWPDLEFHVAGDKVARPADDPGYAPSLERALSTTPGVSWHGGISRQEVEALLAQGGVALSLWDHRHGSDINDLVISTKLLDYCSVGLPVILNRTAAQAALLGSDYPLFVERPEEARGLLRRVLQDASLYAAAARRTFVASRAFTYPAVHDRLRPWLDPATPVSRLAAAQYQRPKLAGAAYNVGWVGGRDNTASAEAAVGLVAALRERDRRFRLIARLLDVEPGDPATGPAGEVLKAAGGVEVDAPGASALPGWFRKVGHVVSGPATPADVVAGIAASETVDLGAQPDAAALATVLASVSADLGRPA